MKNRTFIGFVTDNSYDFKNRNQDFGIPATYLYREFKLNSFSKVKISVAVLGVYSLYVNGYLVNDEIMSQDCTEYGKRITYRDFNITKFLKEGINRVGFILGDGWYASNLSHCHKNIYGDYPLKVCYEILADGNIVCESDGNELASTGAIRGTDNQNGIIIDNNLDCGDFSNPSSGIIFPSHVSIYHVDSKIEKSIIPPVKKDKAFQPTLVYHKDNEYIFDFKQNITGVIHSILTPRN